MGGVTRKGQRTATGRFASPERLQAEICAKRRAGLRPKQISAQCGCGLSTVYRVLEEHRGEAGAIATAQQGFQVPSPLESRVHHVDRLWKAPDLEGIVDAEEF